MSKRSIHVSHLLQPGAPTERITEELRRKFADLGWTVTFYGGVSPDWDELHIESEDHELDYPTLIATMASSGVPLYERDTYITGDLLIERQYVDTTMRRDAKIGDLRLEILDVTAGGPETVLHDRLIYPLRVRCTITCGPTTHRLVKKYREPTTHRLLEWPSGPPLFAADLSVPHASFDPSGSAGVAIARCRWSSARRDSQEKPVALGVAAVAAGRPAGGRVRLSAHFVCPEKLSPPTPISTMRCRLAAVES